MGSYSDDDLEAEENEFGTLDEESSPQEENPYMQSSLANMNPPSLRVPPVGMTSGVGSSHSMGPPMMSSQQLLQQQM